MSKILDNFSYITDLIQKMLSLLGPKLKAVTGNTEKIDTLVKDVKDLGRNFENSHVDFFSKDQEDTWNGLFKRFDDNSRIIQKKTSELIEDTFTVLRSSESGFDFLQKFKSDTLEEITRQLHLKYPSVLVSYKKELTQNRNLFAKGKETNELTKNKPPVAGAISWKKSIFDRIKTPMLRFISREQVWNKEQFDEAKADYLKFAKELDAFHDDMFKQWSKKVNEQAADFLKNSILAIDENKNYYVNFLTDFKVLISEAKYLDRMVPKVSKRILNIALQEEEYYRYVDKLNKMLREYYNTINSLKDVEKHLLDDHLTILKNKLIPGTDSYYLNSLGINDFIASCMTEIKKFHDKKNRVEEKTRNIEDIIKTIEEAKIIKDYDFNSLSKQKDLQEYPTLQEFTTFFDEHLTTEIEKLSDKYIRVGETMLPQIAMAVFEKSDQKLEKMRIYYYYWERRIYNALAKMIIKALLTFKSFISRPRRKMEMIPLFKVLAEFSNLKVNTNPNAHEIRVAFNNLINSIVFSSSKFPRWKDGTCIAVEKRLSDKGIEEYRPEHTFSQEISCNNVITIITTDISQIRTNAIDRLDAFKNRWEITNNDLGDEELVLENCRKGLFDHKTKLNIDKALEKNPSTIIIEICLETFHTLLEEYKNSSDEMDADFIRIDFVKVKKTFINQAKERIKSVGAILIKIAEKEVEDLKRDIIEFYNEIKKEEDTREQLKKTLNTLAKIRESSMDIEFEIAELEEKYRILKKYQDNGLEMDEDKYLVAMSLQNMWNKLLQKTKDKQKSLKSQTEGFRAQSEADVIDLEKKVSDLYEKFKKTGPGSFDTSLDEGLTKMEQYKVEVSKINAKKFDLVKNQKLFGGEITAFPKIVEIDEDLKKLNVLYGFYSKMKEMMEEWARKAWEKIDYKELEEGRKFFNNKIKEFGKIYNEIEVYKKIKSKVDEFIKSLPLIDRLKNNRFFKEDHWERLLISIDKPIEGINFSAITLQQVFDMHLQDHPDKVDEIVSAAQNEYNNKIELEGIQNYWKAEKLIISDFKKGGFKIKVDEQVKEELNNHLNNLQGIEGSKYAGAALKNEVKKWIKSLSIIQETLEVWIIVQTKWLYLEGIFMGNEDIKHQLSKETKTFEQHHKNFKKLNDTAQKNSNIYFNCVTNDTTITQLKNLVVALDKSQKSLTDYLNGKKKIFPRFYFISDEDLLSILGNSDLANIQPHLIKLFDNVKSLGLERGKVISVFSDEGESFNFIEPYKPDAPVEIWMSKVDEIMIENLRRITKEGVFMYAKMEKSDWLDKYLGMTVIAARQIWWTWRVEDVFRKVKEGDKYAMKQEANLQTDDLLFLIQMVRTDLEALDPQGKLRKKINSLIIVDVHARDIIDRFVRDSILDAREFEWESQLRFYWRNNINDILIEQCTGSFRYGYEYQGLTSRLVITPLTDRCVMTLTTALAFFLGGAPAGPAGTGKTETCKDLAKNLAIR